MIIYNGRHDTKVITDTFHKKSYDQINSQSIRKKQEDNKQNFTNGLKHYQKVYLPKYSCNTANDNK